MPELHLLYNVNSPPTYDSHACVMAEVRRDHHERTSHTFDEEDQVGLPACLNCPCYTKTAIW